MWPEDKDLELIFKEGSIRHDHSYDPAAWDQMSTMLDKQRRRKFILWFTGITLLLISAVGLYSYLGEIDSQSLVEKVTPQHSVTGSTNNEIATASKTNAIITNDVDKATIATDNQNQVNDAAQSSNSTSAKGNGNTTTKLNNKPSSSNDTNSEAAYEASDNIKSVSSLETSSKGVSNTELSTTNLSTVGSPAVNRNSVQANNNISQGNIINSTNQVTTPPNVERIDARSTLPVVASMIQLKTLPILPFLSDIEILRKPSVVEITDVVIIPSRKKFLISGFAGIESSWTPNAEEFSSLDLSIGIRTSYLISDKLAISLGANYRADTYTAGRTDYNAGNEFFEDGLVPMFTTADNDMLEISTGLFYTPSGAHNSGFLFSGQLLSNIMLKENYNYNFEDPTQNFESSWIRDNNTLISNLELGVGYRRQLKNGFSADFSPYIKIPINGIGHGNLKLSSFGIRMAVNLGL